ncbi:unnamed protein product [Cylicocyclus nassatus]|uniref:C2H2-type domain-containing protein n=1 Tax=Cylicocyclus nassatus TaxID=53992 RepID=A0AA36H1D1_CYLNA|nr:unnamed protein product [Cylicocyclus nassatus]
MSTLSGTHAAFAAGHPALSLGGCALHHPWAPAMYSAKYRKAISCYKLQPPNASWNTDELVAHLSESLRMCSASDVILSATGGRSKCRPFTEFPLIKCRLCAAVYDQAEEFLNHTLRSHFGKEHVKLYKDLGVIHKDVQHVLDIARSRRFPIVGRALINSPELCVVTPLLSPLASFMLAGVTVSTRKPSSNLHVEKLIEGPNVDRIPLYFSVRAMHCRHLERRIYAANKLRKRKFRYLRSLLKPFYIDAPDLLEHPPQDPEVARLLHQATGLPIGAAIIPARKIRLQIPTVTGPDDSK